MFLVQNDDAGGDTGAVKEIGRKPDDALDVAATDDLTSDGSLCAASKQHPVRKNDRTFACALEAGEDVQEEGVVAVLLGRNTELEAFKLICFRMEAVA